MSQITVKLADFAANNNPNDTLIVYGIGSTLAVILYDEGVKTGWYCALHASQLCDGFVENKGLPCHVCRFGNPPTRAVVY